MLPSLITTIIWKWNCLPVETA